MKKRYSLLPLTLCVFLASCAKNTPSDPQDPYEPLNRNTYKFNNCIDHTIYRPTAHLYKSLVPGFMQTGVTNFFQNVDEPIAFTNDLLQGKVKYASIDVIRFVINSTMGVLGLFDVATKMGLPKHSNSFGNTFAYYSDTKKSPYLIIPFLGPSTFRDALSLPFQVAAYPFTYIGGDGTFYGISALYYVQLRARLLPLDKMLDQAFDPYAAMRDAYLTQRNRTIALNDSQGDYHGKKTIEPQHLDDYVKHGPAQEQDPGMPEDEFTFDATPPKR